MRISSVATITLSLRFSAAGMFSIGLNHLLCLTSLDCFVSVLSGYPGAGGNFYGEGKLFITNLRVIFVPNRPTPSFHSFFLPLVGIHDPKLDVPFLLGKTTIEGKVAPIVGAGLMGTGSFSITFPDSKLGKSIWEVTFLNFHFAIVGKLCSFTVLY
jgi:hypothetical protein